MKKNTMLTFGAAATLLLAACGGGKAYDGSASSSNPATTGDKGAGSETAARSDAAKPDGKAVSADDGAAVFKQMTEAQQAAKSWRSTSSIVIDKASKKNFETRTEVVCPDRQHTVSSGFIAGQESETIRVGADTWQKTASGWQKSPPSAISRPVCLDEKSRQEALKQSQAQLGQDFTKDIISSFAELSKKASFSKGGASEMDGTKVQEWSMSIPAEKDGGEPLNYTVWIGVNDHLPRMTKLQDGSFTTTYSDWNKKFSIEAPK